jgi:hypothetical protein
MNCVSGLSLISVLCLSSLCVLFPVLLVSLDCLLLLCFVCLRFVSCSQCSLCLWIVYYCCALFVFALCLGPSVACVSGLSIIAVRCLSSLCVLVPVLDTKRRQTKHSNNRQSRDTRNTGNKTQSEDKQRTAIIDNPETQWTLGTRHKAKTNKAQQ